MVGQLSNRSLDRTYLKMLQKGAKKPQLMADSKIEFSSDDSGCQKIILKEGRYKVAWVCDSQAAGCMLCEKAFSLFFRRHHCRLCGYVVCGNCSDKRIEINTLDESGGSRVCNSCTVRKSLYKYVTKPDRSKSRDSFLIDLPTNDTFLKKVLEAPPTPKSPSDITQALDSPEGQPGSPELRSPVPTLVNLPTDHSPMKSPAPVQEESGSAAATPAICRISNTCASPVTPVTPTTPVPAAREAEANATTSSEESNIVEEESNVTVGSPLPLSSVSNYTSIGDHDSPYSTAASTPAVDPSAVQQHQVTSIIPMTADDDEVADEFNADFLYDRVLDCPQPSDGDEHNVHRVEEEEDELNLSNTSFDPDSSFTMSTTTATTSASTKSKGVTRKAKKLVSKLMRGGRSRSTSPVGRDGDAVAAAAEGMQQQPRLRRFSSERIDRSANSRLPSLRRGSSWKEVFSKSSNTAPTPGTSI